MFDLSYRKVFGFLNHWVILRNKEEFDSIIDMCKAAQLEAEPKQPRNYPVLALFRDETDANCCGISGTYVGIAECKDFLKAAGFNVEMSEELKNQPVEW